jgi:hypothetical protein
MEDFNISNFDLQCLALAILQHMGTYDALLLVLSIGSLGPGNALETQMKSYQELN